MKRILGAILIAVLVAACANAQTLAMKPQSIFLFATTTLNTQCWFYNPNDKPITIVVYIFQPGSSDVFSHHDGIMQAGATGGGKMSRFLPDLPKVSSTVFAAALPFYMWCAEGP